MTKQILKPSLEWVLLLLVLAAAGLLRMAQLGDPPFMREEAALALEAAELSQGESAFWRVDQMPRLTQPSYQMFTGLLFQLFGTREGVARLLPALAGIILVLTPLLLRNRYGPGLSLVAGLLIALSPTLVALSRMAAGHALGLLGILLVVFSLIGRTGRGDHRLRDGLAVLGGGLALSSGGLVFSGMLVLIIAYLLSKPLGRWIPKFEANNGVLELGVVPWRGILLLVAGAAILLSSGFGLYPAGISGIFEALEDWILGWFVGEGVGLYELSMGYFGYEPLILVIGFLGAVIGFRKGSELTSGVLLWLIAGGMALLIDPNRQWVETVWLTIPLILIASWLVDYAVGLVKPPESWLLVLGLAAGVIAFGVFSFLQFSGYTAGLATDMGPNTGLLQLLLGIGALLLIGGLLGIAGSAFGWNAALLAGSLGGGCLLIAAALASGVHLNQHVVTEQRVELWRDHVSTRELGLMVETMEWLSISMTGRPDALPLVFHSEPSPEIAWAVREFPSFQDAMAGGEEPPIILVREVEHGANLAANYLGQVVLTSWAKPSEPALSIEPLSWLIQRRGINQPDRWLLLVRDDVATLGGFGIQEVGEDP